MHLSEAIEGYLLLKAVRVSPATLRADKDILGKFLQWCTSLSILDVNAITAEHIRQYIQQFTDRGLSAHTVRRYHASLSALWTWLCDPEIGIADANIVQRVSLPRLPKHVIQSLSQTDISAILDACIASTNPLRDKAVVLFLLDSGCRATELCELRVPEIDLTKGRLRVMGKGSKERTIFIGKRTRQALWVYIKQERPTPMRYQSAHVFLTQDGYPLDRVSLRLLVYRLGRRSGLKLWPHLFRYTAAIERLRRGMDLITLQAFLGHEKLETTKGYLTGLSEADVEHAAAITSPVDDWRL